MANATGEMRRPTRWSGGSIAGRIATSACRRVRSIIAFEIATSSAMPGFSARNAASGAASRGPRSVSVVVIRSVPSSRRSWPASLRSSETSVSSTPRAADRSSSPAAVTA